MNPGGILREIASRIWGIAVSRTAAVAMLTAVTLMLAVGSMLPNPNLMPPERVDVIRKETPMLLWLGERLNSQEMATGYVFGFIGVFLVLSTTMCSIDRILGRRRDAADDEAAKPIMPDVEGIEAQLTGIGMEEARAEASKWLGKARYKVRDASDADGVTLIGSKGARGFWGSVFFHAVLIAALIGMVVYYMAAHRASLRITEGQVMELKKENFASITREPVWGIRFPNARIALLKQYSIYDEKDPWYPIDYVAVFDVSTPEGGFKKEVRINDPLVIDGREFLMRTGGFSPLFVITGERGDVVFGNFVTMRDEKGTKGFFEFPPAAMTVNAAFYPDYELKEGKDATASLRVRNPFVRLKIYASGAMVYEGLIPLGGSAKAGGYTITVPEVRRWVEMEMVGEPGLGMFFALSFAGLIGVAVRMIDPDEKIYVSIVKNDAGGLRIKIVSLSRHFSGLIYDNANGFVAGLVSRAGGGR